MLRHRVLQGRSRKLESTRQSVFQVFPLPWHEYSSGARICCDNVLTVQPLSQQRSVPCELVHRLLIRLCKYPVSSLHGTFRHRRRDNPFDGIGCCTFQGRPEFDRVSLLDMMHTRRANIKKAFIFCDPSGLVFWIPLIPALVRVDQRHTHTQGVIWCQRQSWLASTNEGLAMAESIPEGCPVHDANVSNPCLGVVLTSPVPAMIAQSISSLMFQKTSYEKYSWCSKYLGFFAKV